MPQLNLLIKPDSIAAIMNFAVAEKSNPITEYISLRKNRKNKL